MEINNIWAGMALTLVSIICIGSAVHLLWFGVNLLTTLYS